MTGAQPGLAGPPPTYTGLHLENYPMLPSVNLLPSLGTLCSVAPASSPGPLQRKPAVCKTVFRSSTVSHKVALPMTVSIFQLTLVCLTPSLSSTLLRLVHWHSFFPSFCQNCQTLPSIWRHSPRAVAVSLCSGCTNAQQALYHLGDRERYHLLASVLNPGEVGFSQRVEEGLAPTGWADS